MEVEIECISSPLHSTMPTISSNCGSRVANDDRSGRSARGTVGGKGKIPSFGPTVHGSSPLTKCPKAELSLRLEVNGHRYERPDQPMVSLPPGLVSEPL
jgi:hypothetical protein